METNLENNEKIRYYGTEKNVENLVPTNDFFARYLFSNEGHEKILLHFLNALRKDANEEIFSDVEVLNTFNLKENVLERETVVDVKARTETGELVLVEIQNIVNSAYIARVLYYIAANYAKQVNVDFSIEEEKRVKKIDYTKLKPVISVSLLNSQVSLGTKKAHSVYRLKDLRTGHELTNKWEIHLIELHKELTDENSDLALWIRFFTSQNLEEDKMAIVRENPFFKEVFERYEKFSGDVELMEKYRDTQAYIITEAEMYNQEREDGRQEGLKQGERKAKIEVARSLLSSGLPLTEIVKHTGLSEEEIGSIDNV